MRILVFSNYFPPHVRGGYELWCSEVARVLQERGHEIQIVTRREQGIPSPTYDGLPVHRILNLEAQEGMWETAYRFFFQRKRLEHSSLLAVEHLVRDWQPDVAFIWGMWNVPRAVPALIEQLLPGRVAYYLCDYWPALPGAYEQYWSTPSGRPLTRLPKRILGQWALNQMSRQEQIRLRLDHVMCVSRGVLDRLKTAGVTLGDVSIVYGGIQVDHLAKYPIIAEDPDRLKLLFSGRVTKEKGADVAVRALALVPEPYRRRITLDFMGRVSPEFRHELQNFARQHDFEQQLSFLGQIPGPEVPKELARRHALVFPSVWDAFPRAVLEAMAAGLVVIGTPAGGTGEVLIEGETGLTFPIGDAQALAQQLERLITTPRLRAQLAHAGQQKVLRDFTLSRMVGEIEQRLELIAVGRR